MRQKTLIAGLKNIAVRRGKRSANLISLLGEKSEIDYTANFTCLQKRVSENKIQRKRV